jgi:hypothetical protein
LQYCWNTLAAERSKLTPSTVGLSCRSTRRCFAMMSATCAAVEQHARCQHLPWCASMFALSCRSTRRCFAMMSATCAAVSKKAPEHIKQNALRTQGAFCQSPVQRSTLKPAACTETADMRAHWQGYVLCLPKWPLTRWLHERKNEEHCPTATWTDMSLMHRCRKV